MRSGRFDKRQTVKGLLYIFFVGTCCLCPALAWAGLFDDAVSGEADAGESIDDTDGSQPADTGFRASAGGFNFELNGYVRGDLYLGKVPDQSDGEVKSGYGETSLELRVRKNPYGDAYSQLRLWSGYQSDQREVRVDLREAYVNLYVGPFDFRLGHQIIAWGRADGINPTNNLTPRDMRVKSPNEDDSRLANLALRSFVNLQPFRIELVWLPLYMESTLPALILPDAVSMRDADYPNADLSNGTFAGRLHLELPEVEMSVSYLFGHAPQPGLEFRELLIDDNGPSVQVGFRAYQQQVIGYDFAAPIEDWFGLRGEIAYRRPWQNWNNDYVPQPDLQYVVGFDKEFVTADSGDVSIILQYIGRYVFDWEKKAGSEMLSSMEELPPPEVLLALQDQVQAEAAKEIQARNQMIMSQQYELQHSAMMRLAWNTLHDTLDLELMAMVNITSHETLLRPKISYDITDAFAFTVGGEIYLGKDETLYGMIDEQQSAGYTELKISF